MRISVMVSVAAAISGALGVPPLAPTQADQIANMTMKLVDRDVDAASRSFQLAATNNLNSTVTMIISGMDKDDKYIFVRGDGNHYHLDATQDKIPEDILENLGIPLGPKGSTITVPINGALKSARVYIAEDALHFKKILVGGKTKLVDPSVVSKTDSNHNIHFGIIELNSEPEKEGLFVNPSYVDFVGVLSSLRLTGRDKKVQESWGLIEGSIEKICEDLKKQTIADGQPWEKLCVKDDAGEVLRVLSPTDYISGVDKDAFKDCFNEYVDAVYTRFSTEALIINTQKMGNIGCGVKGDKITCDGIEYAKPTAMDIFGCDSGPFSISKSSRDLHKAIVPRICSGFNRGTLHLKNGNIQPFVSQAEYYQGGNAMNHYARIVHKHMADGKGYTYAYDDVNPDGDENASGAVSDRYPAILEIIVGGAKANATKGSAEVVIEDAVKDKKDEGLWK